MDRLFGEALWELIADTQGPPYKDVLKLTELQLHPSKLAVRERTLALLDAATGLRVSKLLALRRNDVDFKNLEIRVFESPNPSGIRASASARRKPLPSLSRWATTWLKISAAGGESTHIRWMATGSCQSAHEGQTTLLARQSHEAVHQAGGTSSQHHQGHRLAHLQRCTVFSALRSLEHQRNGWRSSHWRQVKGWI